MAITDDLRKTLTDPTPLYAAAGAGDLAAEKLKEVPALLEKFRAEAPERIAAVRSADPKAVQERVAKQAKDAQSAVQTKVNEVLGSLDTDIKKLREQAQDYALQGVGKAAEYAVKARETYDELAERGQRAVKTWRGEAAEEINDIAVAVEPQPARRPESKAAAPTQKPAPKAEQLKAEPAKPATASGPSSASATAAAKKTAPAAAKKSAPAKKTGPKPGE
ncbi:hypothetical protein AB0C51_17920 [Streptomyces pathocidini]|uniref:hypothetical protein n=1 Tax=Streptomyces pathocidini TaxID=1650571 RepID=UPI0034116DCD